MRATIPTPQPTNGRPFEKYKPDGESLESIMGRNTVSRNGHLLWTGRLIAKNPTILVGGITRSARRLWYEHETGVELPRERVVKVTCGESMCMLLEHMTPVGTIDSMANARQARKDAENLPRTAMDLYAYGIDQHGTRFASIVKILREVFKQEGGIVTQAKLCRLALRFCSIEKKGETASATSPT